MRNKLPGAQMTSVVIWAQCGSFAAICSVVQGGSGHGCGSGGGSEVRRRARQCCQTWLSLPLDDVEH